MCNSNDNIAILNMKTSLTDTRQKNIKKSSVVSIPKIIMQTWKNKIVPERWLKSPSSINKHMPSWEYVLMTDADNEVFVKKYFPSFYPYYKNFPYGIQRADAIRYMWLYVHGGIYMDLDFEMLHPLDDLFETDNELFLVTSGNVGSCITNSFMASKPGCKVWLDMLEYMKESLPWWCMGKHMVVMNSTGPIALHYVVKNSGYPYKVLPSKLLMPCSVCDINADVGSAWLKPLPGSSWISYDTMFYNWWLCNWKKSVIFIIIVVVVVLSILFLWYFDWI